MRWEIVTIVTISSVLAALNVAKNLIFSSIILSPMNFLMNNTVNKTVTNETACFC